MGNFFSGLNEYLKKDNWYDLCDWIFADHFKQKYWMGYSGQFIKKVKNIDGLKSDSIKHESASKLKFPKQKSKAKYLILSANGAGEGDDLLRHIRNGIAHDNVKVFIQNGVPYVDFCDYKDDSKKEQTAYIHVPLEFIVEIYNIYVNCEEKAKKRKSRQSSKW